MAQVEPMDVDLTEDKENSLIQSNVYQPSNVEKGVEELDVSEFNMRLRYSMSPVASPMSKSYTVNCPDKNDNPNMTRSLNSTVTRNESGTPKMLPLQSLPCGDVSTPATVLRQLDVTVEDRENVNITLTTPNDVEENLSLPSSSSSTPCTPEATTPTKEPPKPHGSPIMRGLKTVFNMFRASQSPIPPDENEVTTTQTQENTVSPSVIDTTIPENTAILASTPLNCKKDSMVKRTSPNRESLVFNEDLEKELQWDETTIIFSKEKIPIHKLLLQPPSATKINYALSTDVSMHDVNSTLEAMEVSYNESIQQNRTVTDVHHDSQLKEKDESVFLDCETTFSMDKSQTNFSNNDGKSDVTSTVEGTNNETMFSMKSAEVGEIENNISVQAVIAKETATLEEDGILKQDIDCKGLTTNLNTTTSIQDVNKSIAVSEAQDSAQEIKLGDQTLSSANITLEKINSTVSVLHQNTDGVNVLESKLFKDAEDKPFNESIIEKDTASSISQALSSVLDITIPITIPDIVNVDEIESNTRIDNTVNNFISEAHEIGSKSEHENLPTMNENDINKVDNVNITQVLEDNGNFGVARTPEPDNSQTVMELQQELSNTHVIEEFNKTVVNETYDNLEKSNETQPQEEIVLDNINTKEIENTTELSDASQQDVVSPFVSVTDAGVLVITAEGNTTIEVADSGEDISLVNCDFLVPQEEEGPLSPPKLEDPIKRIPQIEKAYVDKDNENEISSCMPKLEDPVETIPQIAQVIDGKDNELEVSSCISKPEDPSDKVSQLTDDCADKDDENELSSCMPKPECLPEIIPEITRSHNDEVEIKQDDREIIPQITKDNVGQENEIEISSVANNLKEQISEAMVTDEKIESENIDEEIVVSESNSPYVSLKPETENTPIETPPQSIELEQGRVSPPIVSKGYNFNFDAVDDPFATKTKIRKSPPSTPSPVKSVLKKDNKSITSNDANTTVTKIEDSYEKNISPSTSNNKTKVLSPHLPPTLRKSLETPGNVTHSVNIEDNVLDSPSENTNNILEKSNNAKDSEPAFSYPEENNVQDNITHPNSSKNSEVDTINVNNSFTNVAHQDVITSSSEHSNYFSIGSSTEAIEQNKSIPLVTEDEELIANPFATKTKIRQSPTKNVQDSEHCKVASDLNTLTERPICNAESKPKISVQDIAPNLSNTTCSESSKASDEKDTTVREVNTEDEDTMEGPFIEATLDSEPDKFADFISEKIDQFHDLPGQNNDNVDPEMFIDADAFDFLMNQNKTTEVADSGKESLFLKFDPLFAKRVNSDGVLDVLSKVQKRQSTPKKMNVNQVRQSRLLDHAFAGPSNAHIPDAENTFEDTDDFNLNITQKPMMVVPPVNSVAKQKITTPTRPSRHSMTFTSPAMAVIDRLLSLSANNSPAGHEHNIHMNQEQEEADRALAELRELVAEKELHVHHLKSETKELTDRLCVLQSQMTLLEEEGEKRLKNINALTEKLEEKTKTNKSMQAVVAEYEKTISGLIAGKEEDKRLHAEEREQLIKDRDEQTAHLASMEVAFSDLHSKYEKSKQIIMSYKAKEDTYRQSVKEFEDNLVKMQKNYEALKQHATSKLNHANQELEKINKSHEAEVLKLNAMIKRKDLHITSLEETLAQKSKANEELTAICDELINKVG